MLGLDPSIHSSAHEDVGQIVPVRIVLLDQSDLPVPVPAFQALLPLEGGAHIVSLLEVDKPMHAILIGKAFDDAILVLVDPPNEVTGMPTYRVPYGLLAMM